MSKYEDDLARELSIPQWEFLADHFERKRPIHTREAVWNEGRIRVALLNRELVRLHPPANVTSKPTHTVLTEKGHAVMCAALGMMADMLYANELAFDNAKAIEDWYSISPQYRTKERLIEMVCKPQSMEKKYAYGKFTARRPDHPAHGGNITESKSRPV